MPPEWAHGPRHYCFNQSIIQLVCASEARCHVQPRMPLFLPSFVFFSVSKPLVRNKVLPIFLSLSLLASHAVHCAYSGVQDTACTNYYLHIVEQPFVCAAIINGLVANSRRNTFLFIVITLPFLLLVPTCRAVCLATSFPPLPLA